MTQEEFYSFLAMFDVKIAEKYKQDMETKKQRRYNFMTEWQTKIYNGMKLLQEGCEMCANDKNSRCRDCPFDKICDELYSQCGAPDSWIGEYITEEKDKHNN